MSESFIDNDIQFLPGIGPKRAKLLKNELEVNTFGEVVRIYPTKYTDRSNVVKICDIHPDMAYIQVQAKVSTRALVGATDSKTGKYLAKRLRVVVSDGTGDLEIVFFKGIKWMYEKLDIGKEFIFFGKPVSHNGWVNMVHPDIDNPPSGNSENVITGTMTGVYPSTERLKSSGVTNKMMVKMMSSALNAVLPEIKETLPDYVLQEKGLVGLHFALRNIHFPSDADALEKAIRRLKFEELFFLQLSLLKQRYLRLRQTKGIIMPKVGTAFNICYQSIPFELTNAQKRVIKEIRENMRSGKQMNRLLQGDVGSGKTMVAVLSALIAVGNGYQACIMAPTEVLAQQHFNNISKYLAPTGVQAALLTGSSRISERKKIHAGLEDGSIGIIVGTHALIEDNVIFKNLGFAIIDEQHRFGVDQRSKLWAKSSCGLPPHVLVMTATPIPRTLAMTLYGDLEISVINELPPGRKPVHTMHAGEGKRQSMYKFLKQQIALGRQVFIVYPLIFENEKLDYQNIEKGYEDIMKAFPFPQYRTAIVHGQQSTEEKNFNMKAFVEGRADILVATTVIEVGVDVPNASVMVIESAERFGLSQLHQLRGRVGRGAEKSYCILMTGQKLTKESKHRIEFLCSTENGFELAEEDMRMRGPGDLEGTAQSGLPIEFHIASLAKDGRILEEARNYADSILNSDQDLSSERNARLKNELAKGKYQIKNYSRIS